MQQDDPPADVPTRRQRRPGLVLAVLGLCGTVMSLQQTVIVPVLPELPRLLDTSPGNASWLVTATLLSGAVATPIVTRLADMHGKRLLMTICLAVMVTGSVVGAFSDTLALAILARALQGLGIALVPVGIAAMRDELPPERVPFGVALMSGTLAIGAGAGLPVSGFIVAHFDWHAIFLLTGAAGAVMLVAVPLVLNPSPAVTRGSFDLIGAVVLSLGLTAVLLALTQGAQWGWASPATLGCAVGGLLALVALVPVELRTRNPLVNIRVSRRPAVLLVNVTSVLVGFAMFANLLVSTQLLQLPLSTGYGVGLDAAGAGLWLAPNALMFGIMAPVAASLIRRVGGEVALLLGSVIMAVVYVVRIPFSDELWLIVAGSVVVAIGASLTFAAMPTLIIRAVPRTETSSANGLNTLLRSVGTAIASAVGAAIATVGLQSIDGRWYPSFASLAAVFWTAAAASAGAAVIALVLRLFHNDRDPRVAELIDR